MGNAWKVLSRLDSLGDVSRIGALTLDLPSVLSRDCRWFFGRL